MAEVELAATVLLGVVALTQVRDAHPVVKVAMMTLITIAVIRYIRVKGERK